MGNVEGHIHRILKETARDMLKKRGFSDNQIFYEYIVQFKEKVSFHHKVDVVGIKPGLKIAIEIGITPKNRINNLKKIFDEVIHIRKSDYIPEDLNNIKYGDSVSKRKEYLKVAYNKYIYEIFKEDSVLEPQKYTPENEQVFGLDKHKGPWLNIPSAKTYGHKEWEQRVNLCLSCLDYDSFEISIGTNSKSANLQFIRLIENPEYEKRLFTEFNKLDSQFFTHVYCTQGKAPPRKKREDTFIFYKTNNLDADDLFEIRKNLIFWLDFGRPDLIYPYIRVIKRTKIKPEQIPMIITEIKPLISLLIDFKDLDFQQQEEFKKEEERQKEDEKYEKKKKYALEKAKNCKDYRTRIKCDPENKDECRKCPWNWQKYL